MMVNINGTSYRSSDIRKIGLLNDYGIWYVYVLIDDSKGEVETVSIRFFSEDDARQYKRKLHKQINDE